MKWLMKAPPQAALEGVVDVGQRRARARWPWPGRCRRAAAACRPGCWGARRRAAGPWPPCPAAGCGPRSAPAWPRLPRSSSSRSKPVALPSSCTAGGTRAKTWASRMLREVPAWRAGRSPGRCSARPGAVVPVLQVDEGHAGVLAGAGEAEAGDGEDAVDVGLLVDQEVVLDLLGHRQRARLRGAGRQGDRGRTSTPWSSSGRKPVGRRTNSTASTATTHAVDDQRRQRRARSPAAASPRSGATVASKLRLNQPKKPPLLARGRPSHRLEQGGAQRRRQDQRHQDRQHHGRDDGDRELAVDDAGRAAEERHGQEHRRQHQARCRSGRR